MNLIGRAILALENLRRISHHSVQNISQQRLELFHPTTSSDREIPIHERSPERAATSLATSRSSSYKPYPATIILHSSELHESDRKSKSSRNYHRHHIPRTMYNNERTRAIFMPQTRTALSSRTNGKPSHIARVYLIIPRSSCASLVHNPWRSTRRRYTEMSHTSQDPR